MRLNYGKTFLLGFGFFGVSVIWATYNAFVPVFLDKKFGLEPALIGFFMTLDNIAALLIQPPIGVWSDKLRSPIGRRMPFILIGAPMGAIVFGLIPFAAILPLFVACTTSLLLSMALWRTPVVALMPDITPSPLRSPSIGDSKSRIVRDISLWPRAFSTSPWRRWDFSGCSPWGIPSPPPTAKSRSWLTSSR